jgi:hypothetical protein
MLNKKPGPALKRARKTTADYPQKCAPASATMIDEPKADWVPLARALFYYGDEGYIRSFEEWERELRATLTTCLENHEYKGADIQWSLEVSKWREASIKALGWTLTIDGRDSEFALLSPDGKYCGLERSAYHCGPSSSHEFLTGSWGWNTLPPEQEPAARWHRNLGRSIISKFRFKFLRCLRYGAAHIMARKNTVLAPFERITWDQWQYFTLDEETSEEREPKRVTLRDSVRDFTHDHGPWPGVISTATGPAGEKLYAIPIAPGVFSAKPTEDEGPEKKCLRWLLKLMLVYPDRSPKPRDSLMKEAISRFPGLSGKAFQYCFQRAQEETGNLSWSRPGAPPKSLRQSRTNNKS